MRAFAAEWEAANAAALSASGPLWVAVGDSCTQGIGASDRHLGYVGRLLARLRAEQDPGWRVVNLSRSGARVADVVAEQLPRLRSLPRPDLVTCAAGTNDLFRTPLPELTASLDRLVTGLPDGAVLATLPQGVRPARAQVVNALLRHHAAEGNLVVADVWATTGPPWRGKFAADHFHPNDLGYRDWAAAFAPALGLAEGAGAD